MAASSFASGPTGTFVVDVTTADSQAVEGAFSAWSPTGDAVLVGRTRAEAGASSAVVVPVPGGAEVDLGDGVPVDWTTG